MIRVFAVNGSASDVTDDMNTRGKTALVAEALGTKIPKDGFELIALADLADIGLSGYLADGYAVPDAQLKDARSKLDALDGYVLLVFSAAFGGTETTLSPGAHLTLIGTFGETQPDMISLPLDAEAAQPYTGTPHARAATPPKKNASGSLVVAALVILAGLILWWALA